VMVVLSQSDSGKSTSMAALTFDPPVLTWHWAYNGPTSGGVSITMFGLQFGTSDVTPTVSVGHSVCLTSSWTSRSSVLCLAASGVGGSQSLTAQLIQSISGTSGAKFSYSSPVVTHISPTQGGSIGGTIIYIDGLSFGAGADANGDKLQISVGSTLCPSARISRPDVQLSCTTAAGSGQGLTVAISLGGQVRAQCPLGTVLWHFASRMTSCCSELWLRLRSRTARRFQPFLSSLVRARVATCSRFMEPTSARTRRRCQSQLVATCLPDIAVTDSSM
jgi:hypothetical protein